MKIGDKVRITECGWGCGHEEVGKTGVIVAIPTNYGVKDYTIKLDDGEILDSMWEEGFELVDTTKESTSKWLKKNPWYIRVESPEHSKLIQEWLFEHGMKWSLKGSALKRLSDAPLHC